MQRDIIGVADERITPFVQPNRSDQSNDGRRQPIEPIRPKDTFGTGRFHNGSQI